MQKRLSAILLAIVGAVALLVIGVPIYQFIASWVAGQREAARQQAARDQEAKEQAATKLILLQVADKTLEMATQQYRQMAPAITELGTGSMSDHAYEGNLRQFMNTRLYRIAGMTGMTKKMVLADYPDNAAWDTFSTTAKEMNHEIQQCDRRLEQRDRTFIAAGVVMDRIGLLSAWLTISHPSSLFTVRQPKDVPEGYRLLGEFLADCSSRLEPGRIMDEELQAGMPIHFESSQVPTRTFLVGNFTWEPDPIETPKTFRVFLPLVREARVVVKIAGRDEWEWSEKDGTRVMSPLLPTVGGIRIRVDCSGKEPARRGGVRNIYLLQELDSQNSR